MVRRLIDAGHEVHVWARRREAVAELVTQGAQDAGSPEGAVAKADIVVGCLLGDEVVRAIYAGPEGLLVRARPGQLFIEHATFSVNLAKQLSAAATHRGAWFLDAPVSGGPAGAADGTLACMIGGEHTQIDRARAILDAYCGRVFEAGTSGAGSTLKLINQLLVSVHSLVATEAAAMIRMAGLDPKIAHTALLAGWGGSVMLDLLLPRALADELDGEGATIGGLLPVLELVQEQANVLGVQSRTLSAASEALRVAAHTHADAGLAALILGSLPRDDE